MGPTVSPPRRAAAIGAAILPGVFVRGAGHWTLGADDTGTRLYAVSAAGLGLAALGGLAYTWSNTSRFLAGASTALGFSGAALFALSWLADLEGVLVPDGLSGAPLRQTPVWQARAGYALLADPRLGVRHLATLGADLNWRAIRFTPSVVGEPARPNWEVDLAVAWRAIGATPTRVAADGSFVDVELSGGWRSDVVDEFDRAHGELLVRGRFDFARWGSTLRGTFAELALGMALLATSARSLQSAPWDVSSLLLLRAAYGVYFGRPGATHAEVSLFYDHRHDGYVGGFLTASSVSGTFGHFGGRTTLFFGPRWGLAGELSVGSVVALQLQWIVRGGGIQ